MVNFRKILLLFSFILSAGSVFSQIFTTNDAFWIVKSRNLVSTGAGTAYHLCLDEYTSVIKDTLIDSKEYQKIQVQYDTPSPTTDYINLKLRAEGLIHYSDKKLFYGIHEDSMQLLYDFNLVVGDSFQFNHTFLGQDAIDTLTVESVDSVEIAGEYRKLIRLIGLQRQICQLKEIVWVEGIGDLSLGLLYHIVELDGCPRLTYATANGAKLFQYSLGFDPCIFNPADYAKHLIYPNPFENKITVQYDKTDSPTFTVQNLSSKIVYSDHLTLGNNTYDLSFLPAGVYIMYIKNVEGIESKKLVKY
ncbi:MAG: T9SS type A sorting domain-containing protein [Crocinitomicaceae bacterium]